MESYDKINEILLCCHDMNGGSPVRYIHHLVPFTLLCMPFSCALATPAAEMSAAKEIERHPAGETPAGSMDAGAAAPTVDVPAAAAEKIPRDEVWGDCRGSMSSTKTDTG